MFHPSPAALSIYKQNPRNDPLYSALFPLERQTLISRDFMH